VQRDRSSPRRPLQRQDKGYLRSDLLAATVRSNREVDVFVRDDTLEFFATTHPHRFSSSLRDAIWSAADIVFLAVRCVRVVAAYKPPVVPLRKNSVETPRVAKKKIELQHRRQAMPITPLNFGTSKMQVV
jgi:hypothetical protein